MSRLLDHHKTLDSLGQGKCSVPTWLCGCPAGFCDEPAYGEPPKCARVRSAYSGEMRRLDNRYNGYVPALACPGHGGPKVRVFKDGNAWCAVRPGFVNLQESTAGFGDTKDEALKNLESRPLDAAEETTERAAIAALADDGNGE